jgi:hypothetical protein
VVGDGTLLYVAKVVHPAHTVNTAEVVVRPKIVQRSVGLMEVHDVERELGRSVHKMKSKS